MGYIEWGREIFHEKLDENKCIAFENAPPKELLKKIIQNIKSNTLIGIYYQYDYNTNNQEEYGYIEFPNDIDAVWDFYSKYPDIFYYTILTDNKKSFVLAVELGSDKNFLCGDSSILNVIPTDNDFSIFRNRTTRDLE